MSFSSLLQQNDIHSLRTLLSREPYFLNIKHDKDQNLYLIKHCYKSDKTNAVVKQCDGIILDKDCNVVCYSGEYIDTINRNDFANNLDHERNFDKYKVTECVDGTCIRLYYLNDIWRTATKGHTDASKTKWNSNKNFQLLFQEALTNYPNFNTENFDKGNTYVFLMCHIDNKIVCPVSENKVYFLNAFNNSDLSLVENVGDLGVETLTTLVYDSFRDLDHELLASNDNQFRGIHLQHKETNEQLFVLSKLYEQRQNLKGNTLDMNRRYLKLRSTDKHVEFMNEFPEYKELSVELESNIKDNITYIHRLYIGKFVKKKKPIITPIEWKYLYPIHGFYLRTKNKVTREVVESLLFCIDVYFGLHNLEEISRTRT